MTPRAFWRERVLPATACLTPEDLWPGRRWTRRGETWRGACPLHRGDNPTAFEIRRDRQGNLRWNCWTGCRVREGDLLGALNGGPAPTGAAFVETVRRAAALAGVDTAALDGGDPGGADRPPRQSPLAALLRPLQVREDPTPRPELEGLLQAFQEALPGSLGARYLEEHRGIPLEVARALGAGYAAPGCWPGRDWRWGRLVLPHLDQHGRLVNLYGRAVGSDDRTPKALRHDHLPGPKGLCNGAALATQSGPLLLVEGAADVLAAVSAGWPRVVGIFGLAGWSWGWVRAAGVRRVVLALDQDAPGRQAALDLARGGRLRGVDVELLDPALFQGQKDLAAAWLAGGLDLREPFQARVERQVVEPDEPAGALAIAGEQGELDLAAAWPTGSCEEREPHGGLPRVREAIDPESMHGLALALGWLDRDRLDLLP